MKLRALLALATALVGTSLGSSSASAAPAYPPPSCSTVAVSTQNPLPGEALTVTGSSFKPNATVRLELHTKTYVLATVTSGATGSFSTEVTLPAGVSGRHLVVAIGGNTGATGCPADPFQELSIQAAADQTASAGGSSNPGGTAFTGVNILLMLLAAAGLIGTGLALNRRSHGVRR